MEKKTNLEMFKFFRNRRNRKAIAFIKLAEIVPYYGNNKYTLTRLFLHAEFIYALKKVQNPTVFMKTNK